ncbi:MAG: CCA tRNA nucleotidyltransferase [bacterium]|nr:CCA tRNA nucleotidyltransferase [bacterium]
MQIAIPKDVEEIIEHLNQRGFEAYAVGGCVRDTLLGRCPNDWDITTSALPLQVKEMFKKTVDTGIQHGTVTVLLHGKGYEVTTYRIDGEYEDGRHPKQVEFTRSLLEDLKRRDFTINAMAYSHSTGVVDAFGGQEDLKAGVIRCVGLARERFTEDALRILRALRFAAQLGFSIEEETYAAIGKIAPNLKRVSKERILVELTKLLLSAHPERLMDVWRTGMAKYITKDFEQLFFAEEGRRAFCGQREEILRRASSLPAKRHLRFAAAFCGMEGETVNRMLRELKSDNETRKKTLLLVEACEESYVLDKVALRHWMHRMGSELFLDGQLLRQLLPQGPMDEPREAWKWQQERRLAEEILAAGDCLDLKQLAVSGKDLLSAGIQSGRQMGELLHFLLEHVLEYPQDNQKELLLRIAAKKREMAHETE